VTAATLSATNVTDNARFITKFGDGETARLLFAARCHIPLASLPVTDSARSASLALSVASPGG
jgi:hypothetical protein